MKVKNIFKKKKCLKVEVIVLFLNVIICLYGIFINIVGIMFYFI